MKKLVLAFMMGGEGWRKNARHEPIIVDLEALVPKEHLLRKIEKVMDYEWLYERLDPM